MSASDKKRLRKEQAVEALTEKQQKEQKEAKKLKRYTLTFAVVMILVLAIAFGIVAAQGIDRTGIIQRNTDAVTIGSHTLTSAELNYYFVDTANNFYSQLYNQYGEQTEMYASVFYGLNFSSPLNTQFYSDTQSWADYFAESAIESAKSTYALYDQAVANGVTLTEEEEKEVADNINLTESYAKLYYGYKDLKAYLKDVFGYGSTLETYKEYMRVNAIAAKYYNEHAETLEYGEEDYKKYNDEHFDELSSFSFASFYVDISSFLGEGKKGDDGVINYTDEQKETASKTGEQIVNHLKNAGITSAEMLDKEIKNIEQYKEDEKAVSTKYSNQLYSNINTKIISWLADRSRKAGDFTVIADTTTTKDKDGNEFITTDGYYVVVFEGRNDNEMKLVNVRHILKKFKGGTADKDGNVTYSDKEKAAALTEANKVKLMWLERKHTEEAFIELAKTSTEDTGSKSTGGLYENVRPGQMVSAFNDWCFDESRKAGDYDVVETEFGYHLIYFVSHDEMTYREAMIEDILFEEDMTKWYDGITKAVTATNINTAHLDLDLILSSGY